MINIDALFKAIDNGREGLNKGISTGIPKLDSYIGGIQKGVYTLIFGGSGDGKSLLALYSYIYRPLKDNPDKKITLVYFSLELSEIALLSKLMSLYIYEEYNVVLSYKDIMSWETTLSDEYYDLVKNARGWLESISDKFIIYDKTLNRNTFYKTVLGIVEQHGSFEESEDGRRKIYKTNDPEHLILCVIDHIALALPINGASKKEEIDAISQYAVTLRERCQVSFLILQQSNRNSSDITRRKMEMQTPESQDLKDSGCTYNDIPYFIKLYQNYLDILFLFCIFVEI